jgi:hypothetical protein
MKKGHACFWRDVLDIVCCWWICYRRITSGSGDCGKLVVKRESNSGIAGGC